MSDSDSEDDIPLGALAKVQAPPPSEKKKKAKNAADSED
eukprot:CAMPEP_0205934824 /NCGR_PEP_ID=MMETSP1325-20131115/37536_1 /ASSEMBLY_ACC=CAM_ASM_000708 /TAXON_ID=236786 /ORGANISM="Florenciella sp., Strain RCC1007" /LENGTH=38 /DNA_ID= /DNA_START= /DNA_END= /DNA_ORIENTATION=